jgi:hypothetical protein
MEKALILQSSDPESKRRKPFYNSKRNRIDTVIHELPWGDKETNYYRVPVEDDDYGYDYDGDAIDKTTDILSALRGEDNEEWETVWG